MPGIASLLVAPTLAVIVASAATSPARAEPGQPVGSTPPLICGGSGSNDGGFWTVGMPLGSPDNALHEKYVRVWWPAGSTMTLQTNAVQADANGNGNLYHGIRNLDGSNVDRWGWVWEYYHASNFAFSKTHSKVNSGSSRSVLVYAEMTAAVSTTSVSWSTQITVSNVDDGLDCDPLTAGETMNFNPSLANGCFQDCVGDPVNTYWGNFYADFTDLALGGRGPGLGWSRSYNSARASSPGPLGFGWAHGWGTSLRDDTGTVTVTQENGTTVTFNRLANGSYIAPSRVTATLAAVAGGGWTMTRGQGDEVLAFDPTGRLVSVADRNGETVTLAYSGGRLSTVTDRAGRALTVAWNTAGDRITSITGPGSPTRSVGYDYNAAGDLTSVTDPEGGVWTYSYDAAHRLERSVSARHSGATNPPALVNHYDAAGRVDWQEDALSRRTSFAYLADRTEITHPDGDVSVHWYR
ncbi:MAG TPA: DUF6531 domain-containing protein, partial [Egibacteraceae bacterium]|nr:DUF6531 domain-containing protein [Egibacteraceae bacterium]